MKFPYKLKCMTIARMYITDVKSNTHKFIRCSLNPFFITFCNNTIATSEAPPIIICIATAIDIIKTSQQLDAAKITMFHKFSS